MTRNACFAGNFRGVCPTCESGGAGCSIGSVSPAQMSIGFGSVSPSPTQYF